MRLGNTQDMCVELHHEVCAGKPFVELIVACRAWRADLIIVGSSADAPVLSFGSTRKRVMRKAMVPVLVAPKPLMPDAKIFLVAIDFSAGAVSAAREALALAIQFRAQVCFLHVLDDYPFLVYSSADDPVGPIPQLSPEELKAEWTSFLSKLHLENVAWEHKTLQGRSAITIVEQAELRNADLIVMGTHGRSALESMLVGNVTETVTRNAPCPVLTVRSWDHLIDFSDSSHAG